MVKRWVGYSRNIEKMYTKEGNNEACNEWHDARCIGGIETLEKDKKGDDGGTWESDIAHWVNTAKEGLKTTSLYTHTLVENVSNALLK